MACPRAMVSRTVISPMISPSIPHPAILSARSVPRRLDRPGPIGPAATQKTDPPPAGAPGAIGLLASAAMDGAAAKALRPTDARRLAATLRRLATLWEAPALVDIALNARLSRTLGRLVSRPWRIELGPRALVSSKRLREVVTHEGAHAALAVKAGSTPAPHGPEWRRLMAIAGYPQATAAHWRCHSPAGRSPQQKQQPKPKPQPSITYDHWCPVCQSSRQARRPVKAWRCAACVAADLAGTLEITRRTRRPTAAR